MKLFLAVLFCLLAAAPGFTQQASPTPTLYSAATIDELKTIQKTALASDYAYKQTAYLSNNIGPRLSGSPHAERAVEYVADELRKLGLDVRLQKIIITLPPTRSTRLIQRNSPNLDR